MAFTSIPDISERDPVIESLPMKQTLLHISEICGPFFTVACLTIGFPTSNNISSIAAGLHKNGCYRGEDALTAPTICHFDTSVDSSLHLSVHCFLRRGDVCFQPRNAHREDSEQESEDMYSLFQWISCCRDESPYSARRYWLAAVLG